MADHPRRPAFLVALLAALGLLLPLAPGPADAARQPVPTVGVADATFRVDDVTPDLARSGGHLVARALDLEAFTTIGVSASGHLHGRMRAHLPSGWTPWSRLHLHDGSGTSEPLWVGDDADGWELVLDDEARAVVVHLVRPTGVPAEVRPAATTTASGGFNPEPSIRRREAWGAAPFRGTPQLNARITRGVVHHTVNTNTYRQDQVPSMLRSIQAFHQGTRGWPDIAYNFIVDRFGTIWEARDRSYEDPVRVSATSGTDRDTVTVAFLGDGSSYTPGAATRQAMGRLLGWKMRKHGVLPTRANIVGHTQIGQTTCPGAALLAQVPSIENAAMAGNPRPGPYWDVPWTARNAKAIDWAGDAGVITGYPDRTFRPGLTTSRADAVAFLWRLAGRPAGSSHPFTDVPANAPYREALEWGSDTGVVKGVSPTRFAPGRAMTRRAMVDTLWRWMGEPDVATTHDFADSGPRASLDWAELAGVAGGATFRPTDPLTRGIAAAFLYRVRPFTDVGRRQVARAAVDWARAHVILSGYRDHTFRPARAATRAAAAGWLWRFLDRPLSGPRDAEPRTQALDRATAVTWLWEGAGSPAPSVPSDYTDVGPGDAHADAAAWAQDHALFPDFAATTTFGPGQPVSRSQLVRALYRLAARPAAWAVTPPGAVRF